MKREIPDLSVLVLIPNINGFGGVSSLYKLTRIDKTSGVEYFCINNLKNSFFILRFFDLLFVFVSFFFRLIRKKVVHVNPSLDLKSFLRDGVFIIITKLFCKKVLVYWHGWDLDFQNKINQSKWLNWFFNISYRRAELHVVLGSVFQSQLIKWGVNSSNIVIESNAASCDYINNDFSNNYLAPMIEIVFLGRISKKKGIFIALEAMSFLSKDQFHLTVIGDGPDLLEAKAFAVRNNLSHITFAGRLDGIAKHNVLKKAHILLFPSYTEGMPIAILEGMFYGLAIVTRPVGGIPDWIKDPENGNLISSLEPTDFVYSIKNLEVNRNELKKISSRNKEIAVNKFTIEAFNARLINYYTRIG